MDNCHYLHVLGEIPSTQDYARWLCQQKVQLPILVMTDLQTQGRGRTGNSWSFQSGNDLAFSIILPNPFSDLTLPIEKELCALHALFCVPIVQVLTECTIPSTIKYPNDIYAGDNKIAGILMESCTNHEGKPVVIAGIGVNINSEREQACYSACSIKNLLGKVFSRKTWLIQYLCALQKQLQNLDTEDLLDLWCQLQYFTKGDRVQFKDRQQQIKEGFWIQMNPEEGISIQEEKGIRIYSHAEICEIRRIK